MALGRAFAALSVTAGVLLGLAAPLGAAESADWTEAGGGPGHRRWNRGETVIGPSSVGRLRPAWTTPVPSATEPVVAGGRLFTIERDPSGSAVLLRARAPSTAKVLWTRALAAELSPGLPIPAAGPVVSGSRLYLAVGRKLRAIDVRTGATLWSQTIGADRLAGPILVDGDRVGWSTTMRAGAATTDGGDLLLFSGSSGAPRGHLFFPGGSVWAMHGGVAYGTAPMGGGMGLVAVRPSGQVVWRLENPDNEIQLSGAIVTSDMLYVGWFDPPADTTGFWAVSAGAGRILWTGGRRVDAVDATKVYVGPNGFDRWTGKPVFSSPGRSTVVGSSATVAGGALFATWCTSDDRSLGCGPVLDGVFDAGPASRCLGRLAWGRPSSPADGSMSASPSCRTETPPT